MKEHKHLAGYMERWTLFNKGRLHIRIQKLLSGDKTPFMHSHPYAFVSLILSGGYTEQLENQVVRHKRWHLIFRRSTTFHRIESVDPNTKTLFFTWKRKDNEWKLKQTLATVEGWIDYPVGVYARKLYGTVKYCKFDKFWFAASFSPYDANRATKPSIDQTTPPITEVWL